MTAPRGSAPATAAWNKAADPRQDGTGEATAPGGSPHGLAPLWTVEETTARRGPSRHQVPSARAAAHDEVYCTVQGSAAFQEVRRRYRGFVIPATVLFLGWYLAYVITAPVAPHLMACPVVGALNVALLAGLGQFLTTFLLAWVYARHARIHRGAAALEIRWETQELMGGNAR
ncbi:DUF485 domain-containing protein [Streptomyces benahoarensis]|uniref:DUF485 domain-containing protein n=1 Tax=Streptomyces benahoarensis TaxID=2595054 RepID=A0A553ZM47_9ACTN|nr:DUF485 domain-containing protein [Streptomyces benahoarensis]TSB42554.1 DUF485 domain-containing protein [Streptomyces benahoarensis]